MFQKASKIIITESSAPNSAHPAVGDVGYLNSMYLFFKDRFILLDAFFFLYKSDKRRNETRCERKRFIIDLGMSDKLKLKLKVYGIKKSFFINNKYVVNLTPTTHTASSSALVEQPDIHSMWYKHTNNKNQSTMKSAVKIPYGHIALAPDRKKSMCTGHSNELRCWIECALPVLSAEMSSLTAPTMIKDALIYRMIADRYINQLTKYIQVKPLSGTTRTGYELRKNVRKRPFDIDNIRTTVNGIQMMYVLSATILRNCDERSLRYWCDIPDIHSSIARFAQHWSDSGLEDAYAKTACSVHVGEGYFIPPGVVQLLTAIFFRAIFTAVPTESKLFILKKNYALPWSASTIRARAAEFEKIKLGADCSSAALNRIFEENLYA